MPVQLLTDSDSQGWKGCIEFRFKGRTIWTVIGMGGEGTIEMRQQRCLLVAASSPPRPTIDKPLLSDARALAAAAWQENSSR